MGIRATDNQFGLKTGVGVDDGVLNAIEIKHRDTSCDRRSLRETRVKFCVRNNPQY